jgi:hypothetical protein
MNCKVCGGQSRFLFDGKILGKYDVKYYLCDSCGFLQIEDPYWLKEAYKESINLSDTGILSRNIHLSEITAAVLYLFFDRNGRYLDYAGGYGVLTRLMRDYGFDYYWHDRYTRNLFARGFEYCKEVGKVDLVTAFEVFEHFTDPASELERILALSRNILFSTELLPPKIPKPGEWWYYGPEHGQHVSFYSYTSLLRLAGKHKLRLCSNGKNVHLLTDNAIPGSLFFAVVKACSIGLGKGIKLAMKSRTMSDMHFLLKSGGER